MNHAVPATLPDIEDNDLFTGREVKRMLSVVRRDSSPYLKIGPASEITGIPRSTLKSAAPRYWSMQEKGEQPPIRLRRTSPSKGAHWLFHEGDCWAWRRERLPSGVSAQPGADDADPTVQNYVLRIAGSK